MSKKTKPLWMPLYVEKFLADTTNLSAAEGWAYINLLVSMWRADDGTLPTDAVKLTRCGKVYPPRWSRVWSAIKHLFDVDGDRVTSVELQAERGKANALLVTKRAAASLGGHTTQFKRSMNGVHTPSMKAPKPLKATMGLKRVLKPITITS